MDDPLFAAILRKATWRAWSSFRQWVDYADAEQEMWAWYYDDGYKLEDNQAVMRAWAVTRAYCHRQKAEQSGYDPDDEYFYSRGVVEALIPETLRDGLPVQVVDDDAPKARLPAGESGNLAAMVMDVRYALSRLEDEDREFVTVMATQEGPVKGPETAVDERTAHRRYTRVLDRMVGILGGVKP